jgi:rubrerythrin
MWSDAGRESQFCGDVVEMLEKGYRKQSVGEWEKRVFIFFDSEIVGYRCSVCNTTWDTQTPYCPNCGAKMKGGAE